MPSRSDMDRPASAVAAIAGVVLIAVSLLLFAFVVGGDEGKTYDIAWTEAPETMATAVIGASGAPQEVVLVVRDALASNLTIQIDGCTDTAQAPVQQDAVLTYTLEYENQTAQSDGQPIEGQLTCDAPSATFQVADHPDVGSASGANADEAEAEAYGTGNETGTYVLQFSWSRPAGNVPPIPLPVGQPVFTGTMSLEVLSWRATANEQTEESR